MIHLNLIELWYALLVLGLFILLNPQGRVRVLALIVKLFSISTSVASRVYSSNLLSLLETEISNSDDTLVTSSSLELLYELADVEHSTEFLSRTKFLQILTSIISDASAESILRSRAMMITGRLMARENAFVFIDESGCRNLISAINGRFNLLENQNADECECALEALGQIGLCKFLFFLYSCPCDIAQFLLDKRYLELHLFRQKL